MVQGMVNENGWICKTFQTNHEGQLVEYIHTVSPSDYVILNAGAWTHTSVALRDALTSVGVPFVEVHLSQIHAREKFRHKSYFADKALAQISGFGFEGYRMAVRYLRAYDQAQSIAQAI